MASNDYNLPAQPQTPPDPANQWFNSLPGDDIPTSAPQASSKKPFIIGGGVVAILAVVIAVLLMVPTSALCLTTDDYEALSGHDFEDSAVFSPRDSFYSSTMSFENDSSAVSAEDEATIKKIATFYTERAEQNKSIVISVTGGYTQNDTEKAATERVTNVVKQLVAAGVDESAIKTSEMEQIISGDELSEDSEELSGASLYVSVTSDQTCR